MARGVEWDGYKADTHPFKESFMGHFKIIVLFSYNNFLHLVTTMKITVLDFVLFAETLRVSSDIQIQLRW